MSKQVFIEEQTPEGSTGKLWKLSIAVAILIAILFAIFSILQLLLNIKTGINPLSKLSLLLSGLILWFFVYLILKIKMITTVSDEFLEIRFTGIPFIKKIAIGSIKKIEKITFSAFQTYGGYGIRYSSHMGWAYLMNDSDGLLVYLKDKAKPILIGSEKIDELYAVLGKNL